ncbi:MAG TPA: DUF1579 domain-containing protein [Longimicrobium sp.]|nr:DUF1579 domain-containing protein [Longimicrobium sp.]
MKPELRDEHRWLERLVGEWTYTGEASHEPGAPPEHYEGTERTRSLGGAWVVSEGRGGAPDGEVGTTLMTLGYDPEKGEVVGTFVGSMMTMMWIYENGKIDFERNVLTLEAEGPSFFAEGATALYRDAIELRGDDERVMTSSVQADDGSWLTFMTATYRRVRDS